MADCSAIAPGLLVAIAASWASVAHAMNRVVTVLVPGSARQLTLLEGTMRTNDDDDAIAEPLTFVPECKWYQKLPCSCEHVTFHDGNAQFAPGWERFWHLPSLLLMLTAQRHHRHGAAGPETLGSYFWHASAFGTFKNSLDTSAFVAGIYMGHFPVACSSSPDCALTGVLVATLNWLVTLKQLLLNPAGLIDPDKFKGFGEVLDTMTQAMRTQDWATLPWGLLLQRPDWAEAFAHIVGELVDLVEKSTQTENLAQESDGGNGTLNVLALLRKVTEGGVERCARSRSTIPAAAMWTSEDEGDSWLIVVAWDGGSGRLASLVAAAELAFDVGCDMHPVQRLVLFGRATRLLLPRADGSGWPAPTAPAQPLWERSFCRLCGGGIVHRRAGSVELHFLAADAVDVGGEVLLELLWFATSDDQCLMVGTNIHNEGDSYYSWAHTLPRAHLNHWSCTIHRLGAPRATGLEAAGESGATVSFSGFLSITACRVPKHVLSDASEPGAASIELEVALSGHGAWNIEPLRACVLPRPPNRYISACTATLHSAGYIHTVAPHAIEDWINYHLLIGVEHFTIFDVDGSYAPYVMPFVELGLVEYHERFPEAVSPKLGLLTAGLERSDRRPMLLEPQALDVCVWANRHRSDWVVVIHSFEEYLHSPDSVAKYGKFSLPGSLRKWTADFPEAALFEFFQEPMGGSRSRGARSVLSRWTHKRGLSLTHLNGREHAEAAAQHFQPFGWIVDPLNVLQTAVHFAQPRAEGQGIVALTPETLRMNHYVDLGSNGTRCLKELGGCDVLDESILWAEAAVLARRRSGVKQPAGRRTED